MSRKYKQLTKSGKYQSYRGTFIPANKTKFVGESNPKFKSRLEQLFMAYCDKSPSVIKWSYERILIPYIDRSRHNTQHTYFMDFKVTMNTKSGPKIFLVEIKSHKETIEPKRGKKKPENYRLEQETWIRNQCKWTTASQSCKKRGWGFKILTEKELK